MMNSPNQNPAATSTFAESATFVPATCPPAPRTWRSVIVNTLVALTLLGFLASIIVPTSTGTREKAYRSIDSANLRQIGQASLIYASENENRLPQTEDIHRFAAELARVGGLNDASVWFTSARTSSAASPTTVLGADHQTIEPRFADARPGFAAAVRGLHIDLPSTTPVAWTRGLQPDGTWAKDSPYAGEGGYIVFLGGQVTFYRTLAGPRPALVDREGQPTADVRAALPADALIANN